MIRVFCDKCGADCDANAFVITVEVIHNPTPLYPTDFGDIKITDDKSYMRMCLCQNCYRGLGFPNIYEVTRTKKLKWRNAAKDGGIMVEEYKQSDMDPVSGQRR